MSYSDPRTKIGTAQAGSNALSELGILKGDMVRMTLDGKVEAGDLAYVFCHDDNRICVSFWIQESDTYRMTSDPELIRRGSEFKPETMTIIGRVVRVERDGLPVKLPFKLRGLPYANSPDECEADEP